MTPLRTSPRLGDPGVHEGLAESGLGETRQSIHLLRNGEENSESLELFGFYSSKNI